MKSESKLFNKRNTLTCLAIFFAKNKSKNKGFTLLEIILVMFIVSVSFIGVYGVLSKIFHHEKDSRYNLIAANLAQEGIEIIRNKRDENVLKEISLNQDLANGNCVPYYDETAHEGNCDSSKSLTIGLDGDQIYRNCDSGGCDSGWEETIFERECSVNGDTEEILVNCWVEWESPSLKTTKKIELESLLTNWQEN